MTKVKNWWMPMVLGAVLMALLVGVAGARPNDRPQAGALSRRITVPGAFFYPREDGVMWGNAGRYITSDSDGWIEYFLAPVVFPTGQAVVVESITLYAYDNNGAYDMCAHLVNTHTAQGGGIAYMAEACSSGAKNWDRSFTDNTIDCCNPVKHGEGIFLSLAIEDDTNLDATGVRIEYHHGTT